MGKENVKLVLQSEKKADISRRHHSFCFSLKIPSKKQAQKFHTGDVSLARSGKCFLLVEPNSLARRPIRSTTEILVVTRHQYGISALVPQSSFRRENSGGVVKAVPFMTRITITIRIRIILITRCLKTHFSTHGSLHASYSKLFT